MDVGRRRAGVKTGVVAGSVWESRMRSDEVRGGIKVFNGDEKKAAAEEPAESGAGGNAGRAKRAGPVGGKRKTWKPESGGEGPAVQVPSGRGRGRGELSKSGDEMVKELSVSAVAKRGKRDAVSGADQGIPRSPVQMRRSRSEAVRGSVEKSSVELTKVKSGSTKILDQLRRDGDDENAVRLSTENSEPTSVLDGSCQDEEEEEEEEEEEKEAEKEEEEKEAIDGSADGYEEDPVGESKSDEIRKEVISSNASQVKSDPKEASREDDNISNDNAANDLVEEEKEEEEFSEEFEEEEREGEFDEGTDTERENKSLEIKEIVVTEQKTSDVAVKEETKPIQVAEKPKSISPIAKKQPSPVVKPATVNRNIAHPTPTKIFTSSSSNVQKPPPPVTRRSSLHQNFATKTNSSSEKYQTFPERQNKLQNLVDLVMWRDVSKSTLIFGLGTFVVISSSYTKDISFSFITVTSYLGLFYLAAIFLYRSIICRGYVDIDGSSCVLGEEEAIWLLKLVLPYLNEFLLKLKALFSGDPGTTMKLAVLLFVLARCGSSITIWKMAKFGFFGVFTVPKVCSSYSSHITAYGKFWIRRFRDAWNSCSHKKAVAVGIFTLVWNLCSVVARIWAVFMLYVAFRYYQQNLVREDWAADDECADDKCRGQVGGRKNSCGPTIIESSKGKKAS
ncbi:reticulon-like protein B21 isoform X2 [Syzygium oleosum]|uniref:reticulon-like protein B21 isoform X2 n=1 Tax=Syzygium oleosum TaxID=219896 RepID=UPI0024B8B5BB|nr:reticulon-like protein B21 isoform X2 [Syzygium oleosum]